MDCFGRGGWNVVTLITTPLRRRPPACRTGGHFGAGICVGNSWNRPCLSWSRTPRHSCSLVVVLRLFGTHHHHRRIVHRCSGLRYGSSTDVTVLAATDRPPNKQPESRTVYLVGLYTNFESNRCDIPKMVPNGTCLSDTAVSRGIDIDHRPASLPKQIYRYIYIYLHMEYKTKERTTYIYIP